MCTGLAGGGVSGVVISKAQKVGILPHVCLMLEAPGVQVLLDLLPSLREVGVPKKRPRWDGGRLSRVQK